MSSPHVQRDALCRVRLCPCTWCHLPLRAGEQVITQMFTGSVNGSKQAYESIEEENPFRHIYNSILYNSECPQSFIHSTFTSVTLCQTRMEVTEIFKIKHLSPPSKHFIAVQKGRFKKCQLSQSKSTNKIVPDDCFQLEGLKIS